MIVLKKSRILCIISLVILAVILAYLVAIIPASSSKVKSHIIVIDAGHGGIDGGVIGNRTKIKESDLNLQISKKLSRLFESGDFSVVQTRKTADGLYGLATSGFKKRDMQKRAEIINNSKANYMLSIHQNKYTDSSRRGVQIFYSENGNKNTIKFAFFMQKYINEKLNIPMLNRSFTAQKGDFYIVKCSNIPSIIIECGFLSNEQDEKLLISESYQNKLASVIVSGVTSFINEQNENKYEQNV